LFPSRGAFIFVQVLALTILVKYHPAHPKVFQWI